MRKESKLYLIRLKCIAIFLLFALGGASHAEVKECTDATVNGSSLWFPVSMRDGSSESLMGVFPDLARSIFQELDVAVTVGRSVPWKRLFVLLDQGDIDVVAGAYRTRERLEKYELSYPVMAEDVAVFVRASLAREPSGLKDLEGLHGMAPFGASFGEGFEQYLSENLTIRRVPFEDFLTNMRLVAEDKIDYLIVARREGQRMIEQLGVEGQVVEMPWAATVNTLHFMFSKASPCVDLLDRFNAVLKQRVESGEIRDLLEAYRAGEVKMD